MIGMDELKLSMPLLMNNKYMIETEEKKEKVVLVGVSTDDTDINKSLDELAELVKTAGGEAVGRVTQNLDRFNNKTYVGSGKIEDILWAMMI